MMSPAIVPPVLLTRRKPKIGDAEPDDNAPRALSLEAEVP